MKTMASTLFWVGACCTPDLPERGAAAKLHKARFAPLRSGLRPGLTELGGSALKIPGWDGTEKRRSAEPRNCAGQCPWTRRSKPGALVPGQSAHPKQRGPNDVLARMRPST